VVKRQIIVFAFKFETYIFYIKMLEGIFITGVFVGGAVYCLGPKVLDLVPYRYSFPVCAVLSAIPMLGLCLGCGSMIDRKDKSAGLANGIFVLIPIVVGGVYLTGFATGFGVPATKW
jgi:hypothetical protein